MVWINPHDGFRAAVISADTSSLVIHVYGGAELVETIPVYQRAVNLAEPAKPFLLEEQLLRAVCRYLTAGGDPQMLDRINSAVTEATTRFEIAYPEGYDVIAADLLDESPFYVLLSRADDKALVVREDDTTEELTMEELSKVMSFIGSACFTD